MMQDQAHHIDDLEKMMYTLKRAIMLKESVSSHYASFKDKQITLLLDLNKISSPIDWSQIAIFEKRLAQLDSLGKSSVQFKKKCWIKLYTQIMVVCIVEQNQLQGSIFLDKLMCRIQTKQDVADAIEFLFRINSLNALVNYQIDQNKEYKYEPMTQALFFFILSKISNYQQTYLLDKSLSICEKLQQSGNIHPLLAQIIKSNKIKKKCPILQRLVMKLIKRERSFLVEVEEANLKQNNSNVKQVIETFCNYKWGLNIDNYDDNGLINYPKRQKLLLNIFKLTNSQNNVSVLQHLQNTSLIRKITVLMQIKSKQQSAGMKQSFNFVQENQLQKQRFRLCEHGMILLKCNYSNNDISPRFVCLSNQGISWGKEKQDCVLKHTGDQFRGIIYGKVTSNMLIKAKDLKSSNMFSILLEHRSIDFVCPNYQSILTWLYGFNYLINQLQKKQNYQVKPSILTRGQILWKSLMMNLRKGKQIGIGKARGITSLKDQVHLKSLAMHELN